MLHLKHKLPLCKPEIEFKKQTGAKALATDHREKVILGIFLSFSLKAHNYYPAYHIGQDFSNGKVPHYGILFMKTFYNSML